jgi:peptidoglycan-associated lipoprotein
VRLMIVPLLAAGVALAGCAKKSYVHREVGEVNQKVDAVSAEVEKTQERVHQNEVEIARVNDESQAGIAEAKGSAAAALTVSNDKVQFPFNKAELSDEAKALIDDEIGPFVQENAGVWFEIEGHTDSTGDAGYNMLLGEERAMAVRDYLAKAHGIALSRLEVISYGEEEPAADNGTRDGRAQNRRVVIRVLE